MAIGNPWRFGGTLNRAAFWAWGLSLFALKYGLDWLVARWVFERPWGLANYLIAPSQTVRVLELKNPDQLFYATLLVLALPFVAAGIALTVRRLRDAGLPGGLVLLFFLPVVNLFFFVVLCLLPTQAVPVE